MTIQRNDPCPCGSGQKYKKCCMQTEQARAGLARSKANVHEVIKPETMPYVWGKAWNAARARGDFGLLYDMTLADGPYRQRFASREDFYLKGQSHPLPGGADWALRKVKLDEQRAYMLSSRGEDEPRVDAVELELLELVRTADGWRLAEARTARRARAEVDALFVGFATFDVANIETTWRRRVMEGWERPELADRPVAVEDAAADPTTGSDAAAPDQVSDAAAPDQVSAAAVPPDQSSAAAVPPDQSSAAVAAPEQVSAAAPSEPMPAAEATET